MFPGTAHKLGRATVAGAVAATLAVSGPARAGEPEGPVGPPTDELNAQAEKHAIKAVDHFNNGAYVDSEEEFRRVSFFAPNWRPLHYNLGVVAEAQGKLGPALKEYKAFRPLASPEEQMLVDQRLDELDRRRTKIASAYKRQIALGAGAVTLGVAGIGGAAALVVIYLKQKKDYEASTKDMDASNDLSQPKTSLLGGGVYLGLFGLLLLVYSIVPLRNSIKSKQQLDGIALGRTRLQWTGGAGARLRF